MATEKLTRQEIIERYGYDPKTRTSVKAPTTGATGGSGNNTATVGSVKEKLAQIRGGGTVNTTASTPSSGTSVKDKLAQIRSSQTTTQTESGFKPNKFIQALEDYRPDYSGGALNDFSEGVADVGVGLVKGITRTVPEIVQTLTPDSMWGDNSLLNSESERAKAFRSATTGKTGLQKTGATAFDLASMFVPVGAAGKAASISNRAAQGSSRLAKMVTGGMDLATEAPSLLQRGGKYLNEAAPFIGDSVVSGAIAGRGESPVTDIALGTLSPIAGKAFGVMSEAFDSQQTKSALAGVKDYFVGGNKYKNQIFDAAMKEINDNGTDVLKEKIPQVADNRVIIRELLKPQVGKKFGKGSKGIDKLNEASDIFTLGYFDKVDVVDGITDYTKVQDALKADKDIIGGIISRASQVIKNESVPVKTVLKSLDGKMQSTGVNTTSNGYQQAKKLVKDFVNSRTDGGKKGLTVYQLQGLKDSIIEQVQNPNAADDIKMLYSSMYSWANDMIAKVAKANGKTDVADLIKEANSNYSKLKNVDDVVTAMSKTRTNPFGLTQGQKIALSYGAGGIGGAVSGPLGVPTGMIVAGPLQKIISGFLTNRAVSKLKSNVYKKAASAQRTKQQEVLINKLSDVINKQANKAK